MIRSRVASLVVVLLASASAFSQLLQVTNFAGSTNGGGYVDGVGTAARFSAVQGLAFDSHGNLFVADYNNNMIRKVTPAGEVSTFVGTGSLLAPGDVVIDGNDNLFVADIGHGVVRKITPVGRVSTYAGTFRVSGNRDGDGTDARFGAIEGLALDATGALWVADGAAHSVRRITGEKATVTTIAGGARAGFADGTGAAALFRWPERIAIDRDGNALVSDVDNHAIRKVTPAGVVTTLTKEAGSPSAIAVSPAGDTIFYDDDIHSIRRLGTDGTLTTIIGTAVHLGYVPDFAFDRDGGLVLSDAENMAIRRVAAGSTDVVTVAGSIPESGSADGRGTAARFNAPRHVAVDREGNLYIADSGNGALRKVTRDGTVTTVARGLISPAGVAVDANGDVFVSDSATHTISRLTAGGSMTVVAGTPGVSGAADGAAAQATFNTPWGLAFDARGNLYIADSGNHRIRMLDRSDNVSTIAGSTEGMTDGPAHDAQFSAPKAVAIDATGNAFVADTGNHGIRKISTTGDVSLVTGDPFGNSGVGDGALQFGRFFAPSAMAFAPNGDLMVADTENGLIRRIRTDGYVFTAAGRFFVFGHTDGIGTLATFFRPQGIAVDRDGRVFIADTDNHAIRLGVTAPPQIIAFSVQPQYVAGPGKITLNSYVLNADTITVTASDGRPAFRPSESSLTVDVTQTTTFTTTATSALGTATAKTTVYVGTLPRRHVTH